MSLLQVLRERKNEPQGYAEILRIGLPLVASMASSTIMQFTDRLFLSRYSVDAIAAAMPASVASMTIMLTLMGVCGYTSVLIAQYVGSGANSRVGVALWQGIWTALAGAFILCCSYFAAEQIFTFADHGDVIQPLEITYFRVLTMGSGFALLGSTLAGFFSGRGQTLPVLVANMTACVLPDPMDYLLVFGCVGLPPL